MTREQAIEIINEIKTNDDSLTQYIQGFEEALDMAIEALQAQAEQQTEKTCDTCKHHKIKGSMFCHDCTNRSEWEQEQADDCISRQAVDELSQQLVHTTRDKADYLCNFWEELRKLPSVAIPSAEPKTGHWIVKKDCEGKTRKCICDQCGYETGKYTWKNPNYCAGCGVKMVKPQESEG